jgi:hypothetical protein
MVAWRRLALAVAAAVLLLAGCGHAQKDPFAGTWQTATTVGPNAALMVVSRASNGYRVALAYSPARGVATLARRDNQLVGTLKAVGGTEVNVVIEYLPATGQLTVRTTKGKPITLSKLADTTTIPALPTQPPSPL